MSEFADKVAVIGAGPSGLAACKALDERGIAFDCFEKGSGVGGLWRYESDSGLSGAYSCLYVNTSRSAMQYPSHPMPDDYPDYPHHTQVLSYLESYAERFALRERIRFRTEVTQVQALDGEWRLDWRGFGGEEASARYGAVLVASGHHWDARWPDPPLPGEFAGRELHSHAYRTPEGFAGENVLVIGLGDSAVDIACDISRVANRTFITARSGTWIVPRYVGSAPLDQVGRRLQSRAPIAREVATGPLFSLARALFRWRLGMIYGRPQDHGLPRPEHKLGGGEVTVSSEILTRIGQGRVTPKPWISSLDGASAWFEDDTRERVDAIVYCTGYNCTFPFLREQIVSPYDNTVTLYRRVVDPDRPGLYFIGLFNALGPVNPLCEQQAEWVADVLDGNVELPAKERMLRAIAREDRRRRRRYGDARRYTIHVDQIPYLHALERERRRHTVRAPRRALPSGQPQPERVIVHAGD